MYINKNLDPWENLCICRTSRFAAGSEATTRLQRREKRRLEALKTLIQLKETKQNNNTLSPPHGNSWFCRGSSVSTLRVPSRMVAILFYYSKLSRNTPFQNTPFQNTPFPNTSLQNMPFQNTPFQKYALHNKYCRSLREKDENGK